MTSFTALMLFFTATPFIIEAEHADIRTVGAPHPQGWNLYSNGEVGGLLRISDAGVYTIVTRASGTACGHHWPRMAIVVDGMPDGECAVESGDWRAYSFAVTLSRGVHTIGAAFLNDARNAKEDRNLFLDSIAVIPPEGAGSPESAQMEEWAETQSALEQAALAGAEERIHALRMNEVTLRLVDATGKPVPGAPLRVELMRHEFLFGCNLYMFGQYGSSEENTAYKDRFSELFNYATIPFYWRAYERERGKPNYAQTDALAEWCAEHGIRMKGHPLLWALEHGIPAWMDGIPDAQEQQARVEAILGRYADRIAAWEVVNEPVHESAIAIDAPYRWAKDAAPGAFLILNDYTVLDKGYSPFYELLRGALERGVPFDGIGIQAHEPADMAFPLHRVQRILDQYATLGKQLHLTEFNMCSNGKPILGSPWRGAWTEAAQAEYARDFYRFCFAHPAVTAITWWDLCDNGAWREHGGLLRADLSPKPVYEALRKLIREDWSTKAALVTDGEGYARFRGFRGIYQITTQSGGVETVIAKELHGGASQQWEIRVMQEHK